jgi:hypothetical protein
MRSLTYGTLRFLTWVAVLWTIYAEQRHLLLYVGDREIAFGSGEYLDILVTAVLLLYAVYEVFHFVRATGALDRYIAAHPALAMLRFLFIAALCWGIYRDLTHFWHLFVDAPIDPSLDDDVDDVAAAILALGTLKTGYHGMLALRAFARLMTAHRLARPDRY